MLLKFSFKGDLLYKILIDDSKLDQIIGTCIGNEVPTVGS